MINKKIIKLLEFKRYRQIKNLLLEMIQDHKEKSIISDSEWYNEYKQLYETSIYLSTKLMDIFDAIVNKEIKLQLPFLFDDSVEFRL